MSETPVREFVSRYGPDRLVFLVGAGISMNPPTSLPTVYRFVSEMVRSCNVEQRLPFASHAWVEINNVVVNDKPYVSELYRPLERC